MGFMGDGKNCEGMSLVGQYYLLFKVSKTTKIKLIKTETAYFKMRENVGINLIFFFFFLFIYLFFALQTYIKCLQY